jgi:hypothetical protein
MVCVIKPNTTASRTVLADPLSIKVLKPEVGLRLFPVKGLSSATVMEIRAVHKLDSGLDTVFFMENASSSPIVISFINEFRMEVSGDCPCGSIRTYLCLIITCYSQSAKNPKIIPAIADPEAVVAPGTFIRIS